MINLLPADIILHVLSFVPLSSICRLIKTPPFAACQPLLTQEFMSRVKREQWSISFYTPAAYFAILCNREMMASTTPMTSLVCTGYCSRSGYLRFETLQPSFFQLSDEDIQFETVSIYCSHWINMYKEEDSIKLLWRQGDQLKESEQGIAIQYSCQLNHMHHCLACNPQNRCQKHTFTNLMPTTTTKIFQITAIQVSLDWIRRGFS